MAQRSPYNDRYKTEQKGTTRRSASAAKPKRPVADLTPAESSTKPAAKRSWFAPRDQAPSKNAITIPTTPEMQKLRRYWWILWAASLIIAVAILLLQQYRLFPAVIPFAWGAWVFAMGGAFYLEFGPLRKARNDAIDAVKSAGKGGKPPKAASAGKAAAEGAPASAPTSDNDAAEKDAEDAATGDKA